MTDICDKVHKCEGTIRMLCGIINKEPKFFSDDILQTFGIERLTKHHEEVGGEIGVCLARHFSGDWGDICDEDKEMNTEALTRDGHGYLSGRIMSVYTLSCGEKIWIITEWDESVTTVLLPREY